MGSFARTFIPIGFAVVIGIANGYYAFNPAFQEHQTESQKPITKNNQQSNRAAEVKDESQQQSLKADSPPSR
ncbi:hypothetical protein F4820DRAFT_414691 [Hypoxylon rubiginosum]|uniref:Uncharacterized protein n=1 Tax=Hypoxylon rubiginosum TaxID=110542 RepID=A0ACB9Z5V6_9PEZI|nr:hypothetical protein F4820DRAFT_414691 [Hypoxylon rubiginosum]